MDSEQSEIKSVDTWKLKCQHKMSVSKKLIQEHKVSTHEEESKLGFEELTLEEELTHVLKVLTYEDSIQSTKSVDT